MLCLLVHWWIRTTACRAFEWAWRDARKAIFFIGFSGRYTSLYYACIWSGRPMYILTELNSKQALCRAYIGREWMHEYQANTPMVCHREGLRLSLLVCRYGGWSPDAYIEVWPPGVSCLFWFLVISTAVVGNNENVVKYFLPKKIIFWFLDSG